MKHALRKYLSSGGSALFMVISTMAALMILVTAMYLSVVSSRSTQLTVFNQEQAYVSSTSIADILTAYIADSKNSSKPFVKSILSLSTTPGTNSISTGDNGFEAFGGSDLETLLGAYSVDVTRLNDEKVSGTTYHVYDIAVTVSNSGVLETTHTYIRTKDPEPSKMERIDRFFTGTGYLPNEEWISDIVADTELYFDNEYTIFSEHLLSRGEALILDHDLTCAGAALIDKVISGSPSDAITVNIGNDLTFGPNFNGVVTLGTASKKGRLIVGGNMYTCAGKTTGFKNGDVFVLGDLHIQGDASFENLYVAGNIYYDCPGRWPGADATYVDGSVIGAESGGTNYAAQLKVIGAWGNSSDAEDTLNSAIGGSVYPKWNVNTAGLAVRNITFNSTWEVGEKYSEFIGEDCIIGKVRDLQPGSMASSNLSIVIDTGDDPDNIRTLSVKANCDDIGIPDTFMWYPEARASGGKTISVITVGCGTLVVDVPEGVTYQTTDQEFFGHIGWFMMNGGSAKKSGNTGAVYFDRGGSFNTERNKLPNEDILLVSPDGMCHYQRIGTTDYYECLAHGGSYTEDDIADYDNGLVETLCLGRIVRDKVDSYWSSHPSVKNRIDEYYTNYFGNNFMSNSGYSQNCYYPNVNIFVVSSLENADIQIGVKKATQEVITDAVYYGYIYAPYMTLVMQGAGGGLKGVGGLIVSDMVLSSSLIFLFAQPDHSIPQIVGEDFAALSPSGSRSWRIHGT